MPKVFIKGRGALTLSDSKDFKAQGGEASVYVQGTTVFKIWHDPKALPPVAKIGELKALDSAKNFIIPQDVIMNAAGDKAIGITMAYVDKAYVLCQLFPKAFRDRTNLTPNTVLQLVRRIQDGMNFAHSKNILIVDLNEMNFLIPEDFSDALFIDTTTYQTPNFPATALMESVRDRHNKGFSKATDYFAFAVVSFNMFIGIHPYRGKYPTIDSTVPKDQRMEARMQKNVSVLHPGVNLPGACLPFDVIPQAYLDWYHSIFESDRRDAPPTSLQAAVAIGIAPAPVRVSGSDNFEITLYFEYDDEVASFYDDVVITRKSVYVNNRPIAKITKVAHIAVTPKLDHHLVAYLEDGKVILYDIGAGKHLPPLQIHGDAIMSYDGRLYVHSGEKLYEVDYIERADHSILPGVTPVANTHARATTLFEGVAIQYMLKSYYAVLVPFRAQSYNIRLKELEGYRVVEAKFSHGILMIAATKAGKYDKFIYRFDESYSDYDLTHTKDINYTGLNFTVRADGLVLHMNHDDEIELFKNKKGSSGFTTVTDAGIKGDARLLHMGTQSMFSRGPRIYRFSSKKK